MIKSDITVEKLREAFARLNHAFFESGDYNINIIGIRTEDREANTFNDVLCAAFKQSGRWVLLTLDATTDPGLYWRIHPMNVKGTALLVPGQYRGAYTLGLHKNKYPALIQAKALPVYRDNDRNSSADATSKIDTGWHGINIHPRSKNSRSDQIGKWSAGCQVAESYDEHMIMIHACREAQKRYGNRFTYTLIEEKDLQ